MALRLLASAAKGSGSYPAQQALYRLSRSVTSSSNPQQAQPQPVAAEATSSASDGVPRWLRELGVVRTDWT